VPRDPHRAAWTAYIEGTKPTVNKYGNTRSKEYASKHEESVARDLWALERSGKISQLKEQVSFVLVPGNGKIRPIKYVADFTFIDADGKLHILDAKGAKLAMYRMKKKMMFLLLGLEIEEI
jgi:hypothetical protein